MKFYLFIFYCLFFWLSSAPLFAGHSAGAQLDYHHLGNNQYEVTVRLYANCSSINHNNWAFIDVTPNSTFCGGATAFRDTVFQVNSFVLNRGCPSTNCTDANYYSLKRTVTTYKKIITVPNNTCGWTFSTNWSYCRGGNNVQSCGRALGSATILDPQATPNNHSPVLSSSPAFVFYNNQLQRMSSSMIDPDGDSLVYRVVAPEISNNPNLSGSPDYSPGFSNSNPFATASNSFSFDSHTGEASFISNAVQKVSFDVAVDEYRNGQIIGTCRYSTYLYLVNLPNQTPALTGAAQWLNGAWVPQGISTQFSSNGGNPVLIRLEMLDPDPTDSIRLDSSFSTLLQAYPNATVQVTSVASNQLIAEINLGSITHSHAFDVAFTDDICPVAGLRVLPITISPVDKSSLSGRLFEDHNGNCNWDIGEPVFSQQLIQLSDGVQTWTTRTNSHGIYSFQVDSGQYVVQPYQSYLVLDTCYNNTVLINNNLSSIQKDIPLVADSICTNLEVNIGAVILRLCRDNTYYVNYCNKGIAAVDSAYVEVTLDTMFTVTNTSMPIQQQNGNVYTFYVGNLGPNSCQTFTIEAILDSACNVNNRGLTHCATAEIFPQPVASCNSWQGPQLRVEGQCQNDSVSFRMVNSGQYALTTPQSYSILQDALPLFNTTVSTLAAGASTPWRHYPATGATYRAEIDHPNGYPWGLTASATVEGCLDSSFNNSITKGMVNIFSMDEGLPYISMDCQSNVIAFDPNDKQAFPIGYDSLHYIRANQDLKYRIRFQNTGTYFAEDVVIVDTLSPFLDPNTVVPTVSSHAYTWEVVYGNILILTFDNIMLPDSGRDLTGSQGFVDFKIKQQPNNPLGTVINNNAAIYFDFNPPIITNTVFHTIGENFIQFINLPSMEQGAALTVTAFPNPFDQATTLQVKSAVAYQELRVEVYNALGQLVEQVRDNTGSQSLQIQRKKLPQGLYFYRLEGDGQLLHAGQLVVQ